MLDGVPLNGLAIEIDGKAKLLRNGWKLVSAGTRSLKVTKGGKKIVHSYRPWVFAVCKAESTLGVAELKNPWADWYNVNLFIGIVIKKLVCCEGLQNT